MTQPDLTTRDAGKGFSTFARAYGVEGLPGPLRNLVIVIRMARERGIAATFRHTWKIALARTHSRLIDGRVQRILPTNVKDETALEGLKLRSAMRHEIEGANSYCPVPSKTLRWGLEGLRIDPKNFDFMDIGCGRGYALFHAATYRFRSVIGVEIAQELCQDAATNLAFARTDGRVNAAAVDVRNESALETALPEGATLLYLFSPFSEAIMAAFVDRIDRSVRTTPRPMIVLYANPVYRHVFARAGVVEIRLAARQRWLLRLLSPFDVCAFAWSPPT